MRYRFHWHKHSCLCVCVILFNVGPIKRVRYVNIETTCAIQWSETHRHTHTIATISSMSTPFIYQNIYFCFALNNSEYCLQIFLLECRLNQPSCCVCALHFKQISFWTKLSKHKFQLNVRREFGSSVLCSLRHLRQSVAKMKSKKRAHWNQKQEHK